MPRSTFRFEAALDRALERKSSFPDGHEIGAGIRVTGNPEKLSIVQTTVRKQAGRLPVKSRDSGGSIKKGE